MQCEVIKLALREKPVRDAALRQIFRNRSRLFHPDAQAQRSAEETAGVPSVYELNAAYEAVRKVMSPPAPRQPD